MAARGGGGPPLDERVYHRPEIIAWWVNEMGGQPMDENMLHRYLTESPFFDYTTKNGLIFTQARTNYAADQLVRHRRDFEDQLSKQNGTEFMIVGEPQQIPGAAEGVKNGMYVLRKQDRKRSRLADGSIDETLTTLGTYYVVGEQMFQARSVGDIVGNRLLAASTSLSKFFDEAAALPTFSPTAGYSYISSQQQQQTGKQGVATTNSATASPPRSRDGSLAPDPIPTRGGSVAPAEGATGGLATACSTTGARDARLLAQTMTMLDSFGDEFMDENPLVGEPGHFNFTSSTAAVKKRRAEDEVAAAAEKAKQQQQAPPPAPPSAFTTAANNNNADAKVEKAPSPPAVMTEAKAVKERERDRRGSRPGDKIKRKKSRANAQSPTTPSSAASAFTTGAGA